MNGLAKNSTESVQLLEWFDSYILFKLSAICDGVQLDKNPHNRNVLLMGVFDCFVTCTQKAQL